MALRGRDAGRRPWRRGRVPAVVRVADQPLGAVLRQIGQRIPGRALDARQAERDGRKVYRVKWLGDDGKVRDVLVDAESGKILRVR